MEKIPMDKVDSLFKCLELFYGERWTKQFCTAAPEPLLKIMWQSALTGCTIEQIRNVLVYLKRAAQNPFAIPPNFLEFYRYAKGHTVPFVDYAVNDAKCSYEVAKSAIDGIRQQLSGKRCST